MMYCDEIRGIFPLLIYPDDRIKNSDFLMRPINFHPIWFLDTAEDTYMEYVDLIYKGKVYSAKKFHIFSEEGKKYWLKKEVAFNMLAIIIVFPKELNLCRKFFSKFISQTIIKDFRHQFHKIIKSEKLKNDLIKIPKNERFIKEGDHLKENIKNFLNTIMKDYFFFIQNYYVKENLVNLEC
ncbi:MAG: hypothetical protein ACFE9Z_08035 [Promethearchaeota archaeon]